MPVPISPNRRPALRAALVLALLAALAVAPAAGARTDGSARVELVVGFDAALSRDALADAGARLVEPLPALGAAVVSVPAADASAALAELRADDAVAYAARDTVRRPSLAPNDPLFATARWAYAETSLPSAWDLTTGDGGVVIAVLDSGIDAGHADLPPLAPGYDVVNGDADPADDLGHGTLVAGAIGARIGNGIGGAGACPSCTLMSVKVISGATGVASDADIVKGIVWAADHGADVINLSLGGPGYAQVLQDAVSYAAARDVVVVAAGGNEGSTVPDYPASLDGVLGVAATDRLGRLASFSNHGANLDLAAPGCVQTTVMGGTYAEACGTSLAAPLVAGIAGLVRARGPALTRTQVEDVLVGGANRALGLDVSNGVVDARRSLLLADALSPSGPAAAPAKPAAEAAITIGGAPKVGRRLVARPGAGWADEAPDALRYQWQSCRAANGALRCSNLRGKTAPTLLVGRSLVGVRLRVRTIGRAADGTPATRSSGATARVRA